VIDGVIDYDAMSEARGNKSLWTKESFGDYALHVEWRFKKTSGLYPMPTILPDGSYKTDADGNVIKTPTPNADSGILRADKPVGQWNSMDITLAGDRVTVMLNGRIVIENAQIPGIEESGPIGLQHHGGIDPRTGEYGPASSLIQFRNIWIKRLERKKAAANPAAPKRAAGFVSLFNGKDLTGWLTGEDNAWIVQDGSTATSRSNGCRFCRVGFVTTTPRARKCILFEGK